MKDDLKKLQIIFLGLLTGQIAFAVVANFIITDIEGVDTGTFIYLVPTIMIIGIVMGNYFFNTNIRKIAKTATLKEKFKQYRKNIIVRWALMETGNLFAIIAAIIEGKVFYFALFAIGLIFFAMTRPSIENFSQQTNLSVEEENQLR